MDKYIKEYLLRYGTVRIKNFGILEVVYKPSQIHPVLHTFTIPGNYVVFLENPNMDANELAIFVTSKENISIDVANQHIMEWVNNIRNIIASKEEYALSSLGKFFINAMGKIEFTPLLDIDISPDSFGLEEFTIFPPTVAIPKQETETDIDIDTDIPKDIKEQTVSEKVNDQKNTDKHEKPLEETTDNTNANVISETEENEEDSLPEIISGFGHKTVRRQKPGSTLLLVVLFLLLCTVLGIGITYFMYPKIVETYAEQLHLISCTPKIIEQEQTSENGQKEETNPPAEKTENIAVPTPPVKENTGQYSSNEVIATEKYYVILGSFQDKNNAQIFLTKKQKEYTNVVDLGKGQNSELYLIGIGPYTKTEAEKLIQNDVKGWVLKK
jgi:nucleoid DNA-binding protein/cell division septation protein DedD